MALWPEKVGLLMKKWDFVCKVKRVSNPNVYEAVMEVMKSKGVSSTKAYFAAELKNPDKLVVKNISIWQPAGSLGNPEM